MRTAKKYLLPHVFLPLLAMTLCFFYWQPFVYPSNNILFSLGRKSQVQSSHYPSVALSFALTFLVTAATSCSLLPICAS